MQIQSNSKKKMTMCSSCGGTEFELLLSGKYRCKHCGSHQLPTAIQTHLVDAKTPFWSGNFFKQHKLMTATIAIILIGVIYIGFTYISAKSQINKVVIVFNELKLQQQRTREILQKNQFFLKEKYNIDVKKENLENIFYLLTQKDKDQTVLRLLDDLNGSFNREIVAKRNYHTAYIELKNHKNWITNLLAKKYNFPTENSEENLQQGK